MKQQGSKNLTIRHPRKSRNSPDPSVACVIQSEFDFPSFQILLPVVWGRLLSPELNLTFPRIMFSFIVSGLGIAFLCIIGISGIVAYFVQYAKMVSMCRMLKFRRIFLQSSFKYLVRNFRMVKNSNYLPS